MSDGKRVMVTGGAGMIGSCLVKRLVKDGYQVGVIDNLWRGKKEYLLDSSGKSVIDFDTSFFEIDLSIPGAADHLFKNQDYIVHLADIVAGIGPSIGPDHYEVGPEVVTQVEKAFQADKESLVRHEGGKTYLDLWTANQLHLQHAGIEHIEMAGICTGCHLDDWYSHRVENGHTGRFGALISLV